MAELLSREGLEVKEKTAQRALRRLGAVGSAGAAVRQALGPQDLVRPCEAPRR